MSYCRFSESDIYLFESTNGGFECCACSLTTEVLESAIIETRIEAIFHVWAHRAAGDYVPEKVDFKLFEEIRDEDPDKSMSELLDMYQIVRNKLLKDFQLLPAAAESDISVDLQKESALLGVVKPPVDHDPLCNIYEGPCCPWMGDCQCNCNCEFILAVRKDERINIIKQQIEDKPIDKVIFEES